MAEPAPVYPGPNCKGGNGCRSCPTWRCNRCRKLRPWCVGSGDTVHPEACNDCWAAMHRKRNPRCKRKDCR